LQEGGTLRLPRGQHSAFWLLAAVVTLAAAILSLMGTQLLELLQARGAELSTAVAFGMLIGPSAVGARFVEMLAGRNYHPMWTLVASVVGVELGALLLLSSLPLVAPAIILYAAGNGIGSIARGTVPLALFGATTYPVLMGRLALPILIAMAVSPYLGAWAFELGGANWTLALLAAIASLNTVLVGALWWVTRHLRRASAGTEARRSARRLWRRGR
jgi:hypothetical protein